MKLAAINEMALHSGSPELGGNMLCRPFIRGDRLEYLPERESWLLTHCEPKGYMEGAPNMRIRIAPDMLFVCNSEGEISISKSSLKHYTTKQCLDTFSALTGVKFNVPNQIYYDMDNDPRLAMITRLNAYMDELSSAVK
jgi:hypothetical protein